MCIKSALLLVEMSGPLLSFTVLSVFTSVCTTKRNNIPALMTRFLDETDINGFHCLLQTFIIVSMFPQNQGYHSPKDS